MYPFNQMPMSVSSLFSAYASFSATIMLVKSMVNEHIPVELGAYISSYISNHFRNPLNSNLTIIIDESSDMLRNQVFDAAELYLQTKMSPATSRLRISKAPRQKTITAAIDMGEEIIDVFDGIRLKWQYNCTEPEYKSPHFLLSFNKKYKERVLGSYLPTVLARAEAIKEEQKVLKLYSRDCPSSMDDYNSRGGDWGSMILEHPSTFETLAMDLKMKKAIVEDLDRFVRRREFYKRVGKAWKRGYLLYGPPGTGKSSLVAAMANHLKFDIYDLDLDRVFSDSALRRILLSISNRSILLIEDIDCSVNLQNREYYEPAGDSLDRKKFTLSGILNSIDGLWSSCGDERVIVFTTNHKDSLDPALLRPGRMDMHINMSYCTIDGFQTLASNYLGLCGDHPLHSEIEALLARTKVTPAEVAEELLKSDEVDAALEGFVSFLKQKEASQTHDEACETHEVMSIEQRMVDLPKQKKHSVIRRTMKKITTQIFMMNNCGEANRYLNDYLKISHIFQLSEVKDQKKKKKIHNLAELLSTNSVPLSLSGGRRLSPVAGAKPKMFSSFKEMPTSASTLFSAYASVAASMMLVRSMANEVIPDELRSYISMAVRYLFTPLSSDLTLVIEEFSGMARNQVYDAAELYLRTKVSPSTSRLRVSKSPRQKAISIAIEKGEQVSDEFEKIRLKWQFVCTEPKNNHSGEERFFELTFNKKFKDRVLDSYLPYVLFRAKSIRQEERFIKLYSRECSYDEVEDGGCRGGGLWGSINLEHPATFETLAMDPDMKKKIIDDLDRFVRRKEFYKKVGKAWKRGYLLYGPPGTGKSSLIAAMANYLKFDIYDLELTSIYSNSDLRRTMLASSNRSILVIEDIDCSVDLQNRQNQDEGFEASNTKMTLSGLLNFIDGLWSSCGDERIIVFTTNHKDRLDPALLRPGRMDMHINMSYCTRDGFRTLASNYLGIHGNGHRLCSEIEDLMANTEVTPAEVAEELMKSDDADVALQELVNFLKRKKIEIVEKKKKEEEEEEATNNNVNKEKEEEEEEPEAVDPPLPKRIKLTDHNNVKRVSSVNIRRRVVRGRRAF
ncbi:uncharacterized protein LOC133780928 [Humulus lupulus]|uniref:uncharacterized protein LOC133780928 n=1 Tax=Humulus lupulus TaxID=3486 RepID=UPI002B40DDEF|nr:uncharacterized protein LOC133780928 [Humulus lupulus]